MATIDQAAVEQFVTARAALQRTRAAMTDSAETTRRYADGVIEGYTQCIEWLEAEQVARHPNTERENHHVDS